MFWLLIPAGVLIWYLQARKHALAEARAEARTFAPQASRALPQPLSQQLPSVPQLLPPPRASSSANTANYMAHLQEARSLAQSLDAIKPVAQSGDIHALMATGEGSVQTLDALSCSMDTLTAQKDLNLLGASPPLTEDGVRGSETTQAIQDFQAYFNLPPTGVVDGPTAVALRYSVGIIMSQGV